MAVLLGYVFNESERKNDKEELRKEMEEYIDKKFESMNPNLDDHTIKRVNH